MAKKKRTQCETKFCRHDSKGRKLCSTCRSRKWRLAHPVKYSYNNMKNRAKQRGKPFTISFEYFEQFAFKTQYIQGKGKSKDSYSVDCKINELGYVEGNLQILTLGANAHKGRKKILNYDWETRSAKVVDNLTLPDENDPFPL